MRIDLNVFLHSTGDDVVLSKLAEILRAVKTLEQTMTIEMDELNDSVSENSDAIDSGITLMNGLHDMLETAAATGNMAEVKAVIAKMKTNTERLVASVVKNTPAEVPPA